MSKNYIKVDIVSPLGSVFTGEADMVSLRGSAGEMGVAYGHTELLSTQEYATALPKTNAFQTSGSGDGAHAHKYLFRTNQRDHGITKEIGDNGDQGKSGSYQEPMTNLTGGHSHTIGKGGDAETRPTNISVIYIIKAK
jgi:hypothetical protein